MKNLIIIPARKGSKRVKNKNLTKVNNRPLIYWTINFAKKIKNKNYDLVVSSDCNKVKNICDKENVFFLKRPKKISGDYISMHKVIFDILKKNNKNYKYIILLQPTSPLRKLNLVSNAINILDKKKNFDSLVHLAQDFSFTGKLKKNIWKPDFSINKRTQDIKNKFIPTGALYVYRSFLYKQNIKLPKKTYGLVEKNETWIDIDLESDLEILDLYLKKAKNKKLLVYNK
jgi:CMP-N,N'-diacetyllegionaminic acid synthase